MRLTIACPQAHIADANQLAMVLGLSEADGLTFAEPQWQDADGNLYSCASLPISDSFISVVTSSLSRPSWDVGEIIDMGAAATAQALVRLWVPTEDSPEPPLVDASMILAVSGEDALGLLAAIGLGVLEE